YFSLITPALSAVLDELLTRRPDVQVKLLGFGGERFAGEFLSLHPEWHGRLSAIGRLSPPDVSLHLQSCDLLIQPYPDGPGSRGTHVHPATGEAERRQQNGLQSLRSLRNVVPMNLQFHDRVDLRNADGLETHPVLRQDSRTVSGRDGVRKPVVSEMFQRLAEE